MYECAPRVKTRLTVREYVAPSSSLGPSLHETVLLRFRGTEPYLLCHSPKRECRLALNYVYKPFRATGFIKKNGPGTKFVCARLIANIVLNIQSMPYML